MRHRRGLFSTYILLGVALLSLMGFLYDVDHISAESSTEREPNQVAEEWILEQLATGEIADLRTRFADEADRIITAKFLELLLTGDLIDVPRQGVYIRHAIFIEPIDLENADVPYETWLEYCQFEEMINFSASHFHKDLVFNHSSINKANFRSMKVQGNAVFFKVVFEDRVDFYLSEMLSDFRANEAEFRGIAGFHSAKIGNSAFLNSATFMSEVEFTNTEIGDQLVADKAQFKNLDQEVKFDRIVVGGEASFQEAEFSGPLSFFGSEISGQLDFDRARFHHAEAVTQFGLLHVGGIAYFRNAIFDGPFDMRGAEITSQLRFDEAEFTNSEKEADFNGMAVDDSAIFTQAIFSGPVDFRGVKVSGQFKFDESKFTNINRHAAFNGITVGDVLILYGAEFAGPVDFGLATIDNQLLADDTRFTSLEHAAVFDTMIVRGTVSFKRASFAGPTIFRDSDVGGQLHFEDAQFTNEDEKANFNNIRIGQLASFNDAKFAGSTEFISAKFNHQIHFVHMEFTNSDQGVSFDGMRVGNNAYFNESIFSGGVTFRGALIEGQIIANDAQFSNTQREVSFNNITVGSTAFFRRTIFAGPVDFKGANIGGQLELIDSQFTNFGQNPNLSHMRVIDSAILRGGKYLGSVVMSDAEFGWLLIRGSDIEKLSVPSIDLSRVHINQELSLTSLNLNNLMGASLQVQGPTIMSSLSVSDTLNLEYASFNDLTLHEITWPQEQGSIQLEGMSYRNISLGSQSTNENWSELLFLANHSTYSPQVYKNLEQFFVEQGHPDWADKVYIAQKRRERQEILSWFSPNWWGNFLLDVLILYGRGPWLAFLWGGLFIITGAIVFRDKRGMTLQVKPVPVNRRRTQPDYNPLWYSLDLFIPFLDLHMANEWVPKPYRKGARFYMRVQVIFGWILIPIALLALTGIIK